MAELVIKNQAVSGQLLDGVTFTNSILKIDDNKTFNEPLVIKVEQLNQTFTIEVGKNSEVKIILNIDDENINEQQYHLNLIAKDNSKVTYLLISELNSNKGLISHTFEALRDSHLELMGGFVSNVLDANMTARLLGVGATVNIRAVAVSSTDNIQNIDIELIHEAPHTTGLMHNIAIAGSNGKVILNGVEKILQGNSKSDAYQNLKGIITSDEAVIEVNPILLIDEYDITAGHGATVGKLEELSIYYLMSRGISEEDAKRLMINGLLHPLVSEITDEGIKEKFVKLVNDRL